MSIDTHVPGSPASVRTTAEWLAPTLKNAVDAFAGFCLNQRVGHSGWHGESGIAYLEFVERLMRAADEQVGPAGDAAEKLRAYAGQLERMQNDMADWRDEASSGGLVVAGTVIEPPDAAVPPQYCLADDAPQAAVDQFEAEQEAYERQLAKVELYNRIATDVGTAWGELEKWITENLEAFESGITASEPLITTVLGGLAATNKIAFDYAIEAKDQRLSADIEELRSRAEQMRAEAAEFRDKLRSGNPAVRAAAEAANPAEMRRTANALDDVVDGLRRSPLRHLPIIGDALSVGLAGQEIASGESPSSVAIGEIAGVVGGVAAGAAVVAVLGATAPVWATAGAVVIGGAAIGAGAVWAYEELVPQDVRESIDAGLEDAWDATTDFAEDAWDTVSGGVSDAWNSVFG